MGKHFSVDARAMLTWGRESIKDHTTAVLELVKNSYDAGATVVDVQIRTGLFATDGPYIRIADNGMGMSPADVEQYWLRLGFSPKREERYAPGRRRRTGEKGVGRISADRLGAILELRSQARKHPPAGLRVDWNEFELPGRDLVTIPVEEMTSVEFLIPSPARWSDQRKAFAPSPEDVVNSPNRSGTELMIRGLRQNWDSADVQELRRLLSLLTPPFERVEDFQVRIDSDVEPACNGVVTSPLLASAAIEARFSLDEKGHVKGQLIHRARGSSKRVKASVSIPFDQLIHPKSRANTQTSSLDLIGRLGPVSTRLLFYPQKAETIRGLDIELSDLREFLKTNEGVRVYRDRIRVPPYGDQGRPEGDWLGLGDRKARNPAGPHRADFRVSPHQLVGAVFISRDANPELIDTSGREGLVAGEPMSALKSFLIGCLTQLEALYHKLYTASVDKGDQFLSSPRDTVDELRTELSELAGTIRKAEKNLPPSPSTNIVRAVANQIASTNEKLKRAAKVFDELADQAAISRTLATIGIAAATFGHETQRGLDSMKATLETAKLLLQNGEEPADILSELEKALQESDHVSAWGAFALGRVRRDKRVRRMADVASIVADVLDEIVPAMEASSITLSRDLVPVRARVFAMDVECVVINLLTNAYYFSKQTSRDRRVAVRLRQKAHDGREGFDVMVSDSGPGIARNLRDRVWDPLFTTKTDDNGKAIGTGLGLALVNAVVQDTEGMRTIDVDPKLGGARFAIWLPAGA